jgi:hypothetical protein
MDKRILVLAGQKEKSSDCSDLCSELISVYNEAIESCNCKKLSLEQNRRLNDKKLQMYTETIKDLIYDISYNNQFGSEQNRTNPEETIKAIVKELLNAVKAAGKVNGAQVKQQAVSQAAVMSVSKVPATVQMC